MQIFLSLSRFFIGVYASFAKYRVDKRLLKYYRFIQSLFELRVVTLRLPKGQVKTRKPFTTCEGLAIIIQGPIIEAEDFTYEAAKSYLKLFPGADIIVSTWDGQSASVIQELKALQIHVVTVEKPPHPGPMNVNLQIVSTRAGIEFASKLGANFVIKSRTDCRLYASNVWGYLKGLWDLFPLEKSLGLKGRLITLDYATRMYVPYHVADIFMFGHLDDMMSYWQAPLSELKPLAREDCDVLGNIWKDQIPEVYLCKSFTKRHLSDWVLDDVGAWWHFLAKCFVVVDRSDIGFYWSKYAMSNENFLEDELDAKSFAVVSFRDWICFVANSGPDRFCPDVAFKNYSVTDYVNSLD